MLALRSLLFNAAFYANLIVWLLAALPLLVAPRMGLMRVAQAWAHSNLWLLRTIAGTKVDIRGLEHIPSGGLLVAAKHQSLWETFALATLFDDPTFVLKRELMWIPMFGWFLWKADMVPIDRRAGSNALREMTRRARDEVARGRQLLIFPEGTRRPPGAAPAYKYGIVHLYETLGVPCLPVALNSGLFWPRRSFIRRPGTILVEILEQIEAASSRLLAEAAAHIGTGAAAHSSKSDRSVA
jgi:1-acyl-sn-glycerol-3-phosphate acyltransferase